MSGDVRTGEGERRAVGSDTSVERPRHMHGVDASAALSGSTFPDARISDAARVRIGRDLASFTDAELRVWLAAARLPEFYTATPDERDLAVWTRAFRHRVEQILNGGPCPQ